MACSMYYLKRFFGIKEIILVAVLLGAGVGVFFWTGSLFMLILGAIALLVLAVAVIIFVVTSKKGYNMEFKQRKAVNWEITFYNDSFTVVTFENDGEESFTESRPYVKVERLKILKDKVYLYATPAIFYYIKYDSFTEGDFIGFCEFLKTHIPPEKFRMTGKRPKQYPYTR